MNQDNVIRTLCWIIAHPKLNYIESGVISIVWLSRVGYENLFSRAWWINFLMAVLLIMLTITLVRISHGGDKFRDFILNRIREPKTFFLIFYYFVCTRLEYPNKYNGILNKRVKRTLANPSYFEKDLQKIFEQGQKCLGLTKQRSLSRLLGIDYPRLKKAFGKINANLKSEYGDLVHEPLMEIMPAVRDSLITPLGIFSPSFSGERISDFSVGDLSFLLQLSKNTSYEDSVIKFAQRLVAILGNISDSSSNLKVGYERLCLYQQRCTARMGLSLSYFLDRKIERMNLSPNLSRFIEILSSHWVSDRNDEDLRDSARACQGALLQVIADQNNKRRQLNFALINQQGGIPQINFGDDIIVLAGLSSSTLDLLSNWFPEPKDKIKMEIYILQKPRDVIILNEHEKFRRRLVTEGFSNVHVFSGPELLQIGTFPRRLVFVLGFEAIDQQQGTALLHSGLGHYLHLLIWRLGQTSQLGVSTLLVGSTFKELDWGVGSIETERASIFWYGDPAINDPANKNVIWINEQFVPR